MVPKQAGPSGFSGFLYSHNPFYLISAFLVLAGLHQALGDVYSVSAGWLLMALLCGYTLLLALTGFVIVRFGQVWDDARSLLLVVLLMFVALSVSFDKQLLDQPLYGLRFLALGLGFAGIVSESILHSLGIRLPARYRVPYYLLLILLFLYPLVLAKLSFDGHDAAMSLGVFLFPVVAAVAFATLLPAARIRDEGESRNGTPWSWPSFPWAIFAFLLIVIALRSYSFSMAFESAKGSAVSFQPYFLAPLLLVGSLLLLELGTSCGSQTAQRIAMVMPLLLLLMAFPGTNHGPVAARFLSTLCSTIGSPAQILLVSAGVFYAMAWLRRLPGGELGFIACLSLASVIDSDTISLKTLASFQPQWLVLIAGVELMLGLWRKSSLRLMAGGVAAMFAFAGTTWMPAKLPHASLLLAHGVLLLLVVVTLFLNDSWARWMRRVLAPVIPALAIVAATIYESFLPKLPSGWLALWISALSMVAFLFWRRRREIQELFYVMATWGAGLGYASRTSYLALEATQLNRGLPWLAGGVAALAIATLVSLAKGGLLTRGWHWLRRTSRG